jgi:hypothetical protein
MKARFYLACRYHGQHLRILLRNQEPLEIWGTDMTQFDVFFETITISWRTDCQGRDIGWRSETITAQVSDSGFVAVTGGEMNTWLLEMKLKRSVDEVVWGLST